MQSNARYIWTVRTQSCDPATDELGPVVEHSIVRDFHPQERRAFGESEEDHVLRAAKYLHGGPCVVSKVGWEAVAPTPARSSV